MLWRPAWKGCRCIFHSHPTQAVIARRTLSLTSKYHEKCHYTVLGIQRTATQEEIKKAYLEKAKLYHPDANPDNEKVHAKFLEVQQAYEALTQDKDSIKESRTGFQNNKFKGKRPIEFQKYRYSYQDDNEEYQRIREEYARGQYRQQRQQREQQQQEHEARAVKPSTILLSIIAVIAFLNLRRCMAWGETFREQNDEHSRQYIKAAKRDKDYNRSHWVPEIEGYDPEEVMKGVEKKK